MRISDWSSDVCSSDLDIRPDIGIRRLPRGVRILRTWKHDHFVVGEILAIRPSKEGGRQMNGFRIHSCQNERCHPTLDVRIEYRDIPAGLRRAVKTGHECEWVGEQQRYLRVGAGRLDGYPAARGGKRGV